MWNSINNINVHGAQEEGVPNVRTSTYNHFESINLDRSGVKNFNSNFKTTSRQISYEFHTMFL